MAKITLTPADMMKGEPHKEGWRKATLIEAVVGTNKKEDGINYTATFKLDDDPDGRTIDKIFSSKAIGFIKPFLAAIANKTIQEFIAEHKTKGLDFEFETLVGSKCQVKIGTRLFDGRPVSEVQDFAPYDAVASL